MDFLLQLPFISSSYLLVQLLNKYFHLAPNSQAHIPLPSPLPLLLSLLFLFSLLLLTLQLYFLSTLCGGHPYISSLLYAVPGVGAVPVFCRICNTCKCTKTPLLIYISLLLSETESTVLACKFVNMVPWLFSCHSPRIHRLDCSSTAHRSWCKSFRIASWCGRNYSFYNI